MMQVTVPLDARYAIAPDGSVWSQAGMARSFWERYLEVFDKVNVVARASRIDRMPEGWLRVDSNEISFSAVPDYSGPWQCLRHYPELRVAIRQATPQAGAVILRGGSQIANSLEKVLFRRQYPYGLEVIGDPHEVFAPGVIDHPLRPFFRWHFSRKLRSQCERAIGVAYVTKRALQSRYPARAISMSISDVELCAGRSGPVGDGAIVKESRPAKVRGPYQIVTVGSLAQLYKGTDVLLEAVAACVRTGLDLNVVIVGDGKYRQQLEQLAERLGVSSRARFLGQLTAGEPVRQCLDAADLFVLPSRTEGLPRALVEAMARALPCIASQVGGIPELLDPSELVLPGNAAQLASRIREVLQDPARMEAMSRRNLAAAQEFYHSGITERRREFYQLVRDRTREWEERQPSALRP